MKPTKRRSGRSTSKTKSTPAKPVEPPLEPTFYPCVCSRFKVAAGLCDFTNKDGTPR